jgi:HEAT repeat protein
VDASHILLSAFLGLALLAGFLYWTGALGAAIRLFQSIFDALVQWGFRLWKPILSWADWIRFLLLTLSLLAVGQAIEAFYPQAGVVIGGALLYFGVITCLAYIRIDQERAEVGRGYKALHNPGQGQVLAVDLVRHGPQVGILLLLAATFAIILGFAQLNEGLYYSVGRSWYAVHNKPPEELDFGDFLAYALFNLFRVIDLIDLVNSLSREVMIRPELRQARWPSSTLLALFKIFFSVLLLRQIFSALGHGKLLQQAVNDFWSPHTHIRDRAGARLPSYGAEVIVPLFRSLRALDAVTAEQREHLPRVLADIGPSAGPKLVKHLSDPNEIARGIAAYSLGMICARHSVRTLIQFANDPSDYVRQSVAQALGMICVGTEKSDQFVADRSVARPAVAVWLSRRLFGARQEPTHQLDPVTLAVDTLRHALRDPSPLVREEAAHSLGTLGSAAAAATTDLIAALDDASDSVRCQAVGSLSRAGAPSTVVVRALVARLADPNATIQVAVAQALGSMKQEATTATQALVPLLHSSDEAVRQAAADAIGEIGAITPEALDELSEALESSDNLVRAQTAEILGNIGQPAAAATPGLVEALADDNDRVRAKAVAALGKMGESAAVAVPELVRALKDQDTWVNALAAEALGEIGAASDESAPAQVIAGLTRSLRHANPQVRGKAAESLGKLGADAESAVSLLEKVAKRDEDAAVRRESLRALGEIGPLSDASREILLSSLDDPNPEVRVAALEALGKRGEPTDPVVHTVVRALQDANELVQVEAARTLSQWADARPEVLEGLCRLLESSNPATQAHAARALGKFGTVATSAGPALLIAASRGTEEVREHALRALALVQPPEAVAAFRAALTDSRSENRKIASAGLLKLTSIPDELQQDAIAGLRDVEARVRANIAGLLARQATVHPEAVPPLLENLTDVDEAVRLNAALALRAVASPKVTAAFEVLLADRNPRLRLLAADVLLLTDRAHAKAIQVVVGALSDPKAKVRRQALGLIGVMGASVPDFLVPLREQARADDDRELRDLAGKLLAEAEKARMDILSPTA